MSPSPRGLRGLAQTELAFPDPAELPPGASGPLDIGEFLARYPGGDDADAAPVHLACVPTPIGAMLAGVQEGALVFLEFTNNERLARQFGALRARFRGRLLAGSDILLDQTARELAEYFAGERRSFSLPLRYPGTPFEERVWRALLDLRHGQTCSYEELAIRTSTKGAVRAVGSANGRNRIAIVIPCHRVVNKSGGLGGYGGGLWRKRFLLELERPR